MSLDLFRLDGRVAIITGAGRGLGPAMARALARAGAQVVLCSRHLEECERARAGIEKETATEGLALQIDVTRRQDVERLAQETLRKFGRVDILVNNAAINLRKSFLEITDVELSQLMDINYKGVYLCCQVIGRHMVERRSGRVINVASIVSIRGVARGNVYCASKGALLQLTRCLALEWAPFNVRVNALCPGAFRTPMNDDIVADAAAYQTSINRVPLKRWGEPEEVGGAVIFLASEASSFVTGSALYVDGGQTAQ